MFHTVTRQTFAGKDVAYPSNARNKLLPALHKKHEPVNQPGFAKPIPTGGDFLGTLGAKDKPRSSNPHNKLLKPSAASVNREPAPKPGSLAHSVKSLHALEGRHSELQKTIMDMPRQYAEFVAAETKKKDDLEHHAALTQALIDDPGLTPEQAEAAVKAGLKAKKDDSMESVVRKILEAVSAKGKEKTDPEGKEAKTEAKTEDDPEGKPTGGVGRTPSKEELADFQQAIVNENLKRNSRSNLKMSQNQWRALIVRIGITRSDKDTIAMLAKKFENTETDSPKKDAALQALLQVRRKKIPFKKIALRDFEKMISDAVEGKSPQRGKGLDLFPTPRPNINYNPPVRRFFNRMFGGGSGSHFSKYTGSTGRLPSHLDAY